MTFAPLPPPTGRAAAEAVVYVKTLADRCAAAVVRRGVCIINRKGKGRSLAWCDCRYGKVKKGLGCMS